MAWRFHGGPHRTGLVRVNGAGSDELAYPHFAGCCACHLHSH